MKILSISATNIQHSQKNSMSLLLCNKIAEFLNCKEIQCEVIDLETILCIRVLDVVNVLVVKDVVLIQISIRFTIKLPGQTQFFYFTSLCSHSCQT